MNIRKGDTVLVLAGKDRGKRGVGGARRAHEARPGRRGPGHQHGEAAPAPAVADPAGGRILDLPVPLHISNVQVVCPRCDRPTRVSPPAARGRTKRVRVCKHCGEQMEVAQ